MPQINLLDKSVYELIAAGEVIESPVSIVKELMENSMDSGASVISVEIKNGGRTYIRVSDDGCGISHEDVPKAFIRHATSKVSTKSDLEKIMTMGFRGEALASVCAVSKTEVFTRENYDEMGTYYYIAANEQITYTKTGCPTGTTVIVHDLFYNIPARLKFLKKDTAESNRIHELISKLAVSRPEIKMKFIRDGKTLFATAGDGKLYSAVYSAFGRDFANDLIPVKYECDKFSAEGFVCRPIAAKSNRKKQIFYVNDRYVQSDVCSQALEEAYHSRIMTGKFPSCVIKIKCSPEIVDINVHPAKTIVRFSDNKFIYESVYYTVKQGLEDKDKPLDTDEEGKKYFDARNLYVNPQSPEAEQMIFAPEYSEEPESTDSRAYSGEFNYELEDDPVPVPSEQFHEQYAEKNDDEPKKAPLDDVEDLFLKSLEQKLSNFSEGKPDNSPKSKTSDESAEKMLAPVFPQQDLNSDGFKYVKSSDFEARKMPVKVSPVIPENKGEPKAKLYVIGEILKTYIVAQYGSDLVLIDKHAAHERHIYEQIRFDRGNLAAQMMLDPMMITLDFDEYEAVTSNIEKFDALGFVIEAENAPTIAVKGMPAVIRDGDPTSIIMEIAHKLLSGARDFSPQLYDDIYRMMACKAAIKAHDDNTIEELRKLADLVIEEDLRYCPHGRPVMIKMTEKEIEKKFKRIV